MTGRTKGNTLKQSLSDLNNLHPLVGGPVAGLLAVAIAVLAAPGFGTERAWLVMVTVAAGAGIGQWIRSRSRREPRP